MEHTKVRSWKGWLPGTNEFSSWMRSSKCFHRGLEDWIRITRQSSQSGFPCYETDLLGFFFSFTMNMLKVFLWPFECWILFRSTFIMTYKFITISFIPFWRKGITVTYLEVCIPRRCDSIFNDFGLECFCPNYKNNKMVTLVYIKLKQ